MADRVGDKRDIDTVTEILKRMGLPDPSPERLGEGVLTINSVNAPTLTQLRDLTKARHDAKGKALSLAEINASIEKAVFDNNGQTQHQANGSPDRANLRKFTEFLKQYAANPTAAPRVPKDTAVAVLSAPAPPPASTATTLSAMNDTTRDVYNSFVSRIRFNGTEDKTPINTWNTDQGRIKLREPLDIIGQGSLKIFNDAHVDYVDNFWKNPANKSFGPEDNKKAITEAARKMYLATSDAKSQALALQNYGYLVQAAEIVATNENTDNARTTVEALRQNKAQITAVPTAAPAVAAAPPPPPPAAPPAPPAAPPSVPSPAVAPTPPPPAAAAPSRKAPTAITEPTAPPAQTPPAAATRKPRGNLKAAHVEANVKELQKAYDDISTFAKATEEGKKAIISGELYRNSAGELMTSAADVYTKLYDMKRTAATTVQAVQPAVPGAAPAIKPPATSKTPDMQDASLAPAATPASLKVTYADYIDHAPTSDPVLLDAVGLKGKQQPAEQPQQAAQAPAVKSGLIVAPV